MGKGKISTKVPKNLAIITDIGNVINKVGKNSENLSFKEKIKIGKFIRKKGLNSIEAAKSFKIHHSNAIKWKKATEDNFYIKDVVGRLAFVDEIGEQELKQYLDGFNDDYFLPKLQEDIDFIHRLISATKERRNLVGTYTKSPHHKTLIKLINKVGYKVVNGNLIALSWVIACSDGAMFITFAAPNYFMIKIGKHLRRY